MKNLRIINSVLAALVVFGMATFGWTSGQVLASSHREAPLILEDPVADGTDVYAFVSPDNANTVTLVANYIPLQQPSAGPNFYRFGDDVYYEINVDKTGNARADITFQFRFRTEVRNANTFLYNTGQVTSLDDADLNVRQFYEVVRLDREFRNGNQQVVRVQTLVSNAPVAPANIGPRSTPDYEANLARPAIRPLLGGGQVFAGPRDDPFFVDLGSAFDLLGLRPLNQAHLLPLPTEEGVDGVAGYNVHTLAIQVPISGLELRNGVMGVWSASKRQANRVVNQFQGTITRSGPWVGVSRLGMPLVNEVVVPLAFKDTWNFSRPDGDGRFAAAVLAPEPTRLMNLLYPPLIDTETTNRQDILAIFATGLRLPDGSNFNQLPTVNASEMIRLNTGIAPTADASRLGVLAGDLAGFPNGRRLADDVVDIELRALACGYGAVGDLVFQVSGNCNPDTYNRAPNNALTDGIDGNDKAFTATFPYMAEPFQGYEAQPPVAGAAPIGFGIAGAGLGLAFLFFYHRRRATTRQPVEEAA